MGAGPAGYPHAQFTFLGFTFRPAEPVDKNGKYFTSFLPAISRDALKKLSERCGLWRLHRRPVVTPPICALVNPVLRGWINYYGRFYRSALTRCSTHQHLPVALAQEEVPDRHEAGFRRLGRAMRWLPGISPTGRQPPAGR